MSQSSQGRPEDIFQKEIIPYFSTFDEFLKFARSSNGLCLDEHQIDDIKADQGYQNERKLAMLQKWRGNLGHDDAVSKIRSIFENYKKRQEGAAEGCIMLENSIYLYPQRYLEARPYIYYGEQRNEVTSPRPLIIKRLDYSQETLREAEALQGVSHHQNVVAYIGAGWFKQDQLDFIYIAMEHCLEQNLYDFIKSLSVALDDNLRLIWPKQTLDGLRFIHSKDWAHRDLKPHNMLISRDKKTLKLADFGCSKARNPGRSISKSSRLVGSDGYRAPETYNNNIADMRSDVFSLGLLMFFIWSDGMHPYGPDPDDWNSNIKKNRNRSFEQLQLKADHLENAEGQLDKMLQFDAGSRPTAEDIWRQWPFRQPYSSMFNHPSADNLRNRDVG